MLLKHGVDRLRSTFSKLDDGVSLDRAAHPVAVRRRRGSYLWAGD